jgi:hypothetical protein
MPWLYGGDRPSLPYKSGMAPRLAEKSRVSRSPDALHRTVDGEAVIVDLRSDRFFGLDAVGTVAWEGMEAETTPAALADRIAAVFAVERERALRDLLDLLREMARRGLVKVRRP